MKVMLSMPSGRGTVRIEAMQSLFATTKVIEGLGGTTTFNTISYAEPAVARNLLATQFLDSDSDILIMQDDDVQVHPTVVRRIFEIGYDFTGVYLPQRKIDLNTFATHVRNGLSDRAAQRAAAPLVGPRFPTEQTRIDKNEIMQMPWIGAGFLVLKRSVFTTILDAGEISQYYFNLPAGQFKIKGFFDNVLRDEDSNYEGEDVSFCKRYTRSGGKVYAYHGAGITHFGTMGFSS